MELSVKKKIIYLHLYKVVKLTMIDGVRIAKNKKSLQNMR